MCPGLLPNRENVNLFLSNALAQYESFQQGTQTMGSAIERDINGQDSNGKHAISIGWSRVVLKLHISDFRAFCLLYGGTVGDATDALWSSLTNVTSWKFDATQISPQNLLLNVSCIVTCSVALCSFNCSNYCQKRMLAEALRLSWETAILQLRSAHDNQDTMRWIWNCLSSNSDGYGNT